MKLGGVGLPLHGTHVIGEAAWKRLPEKHRRAYVRMVLDPELFARGSVRHPDHATILLRECTGSS